MTGTPALLTEIVNALGPSPTPRQAGIVRRVTDLLLTRNAVYSQQQVDVFDQVFLRLIRIIETDARVELAQNLAVAHYDLHGVLRTLSLDADADVALPILRASPFLDEATLIECAGRSGQAHLLAISSRLMVTPAVSTILLVRGDETVIVCLAGNHGAQFSEAGFQSLVERAVGVDALAEAAGRRADLPRNLFLKLLSKASAAVRATLEAENAQSTSRIRGVVEDVTRSIALKAAHEPRDFRAAAAEVAALRAAGHLNDEAVAGWAGGGRFEPVCAALATLCEIPVGAVETALTEPRNDPALLMTRGAGLAWPTAKAILLMKAAPRPLSPQELEAAAASFERVKRSTAQQVLQLYRARA